MAAQRQMVEARWREGGGHADEEYGDDLLGYGDDNVHMNLLAIDADVFQNWSCRSTESILDTFTGIGSQRPGSDTD
ncbi:hypothetical protein LTR84_004824 [Exophiala bonariae]|uniref:Uncharacterized protein n=1 Tax=Exophiala bonariae TaxID=1690606 RepID=A0AAV9NRJ0_9EURO|nr:hypothetical protein LTR84_004824 [Exophiala bonariae]